MGAVGGALSSDGDQFAGARVGGTSIIPSSKGAFEDTVPEPVGPPLAADLPERPILWAIYQSVSRIPTSPSISRSIIVIAKSPVVAMAFTNANPTETDSMRSPKINRLRHLLLAALLGFCFYGEADCETLYYNDFSAEELLGMTPEATNIEVVDGALHLNGTGFERNS